jgi:predicted DNA-binding transcriptional regulator YafY
MTPRTAAQNETLRALAKIAAKISIAYREAQDRESERIVWPFALAFFDSARVMVAWCEMRQGFRNFRTDRLRVFSPGQG